MDRYHRQATWARDPIIRREPFDALQQILHSGGFIKGRHRYEDLVDTGFAQRAMGAPRRA